VRQAALESGPLPRTVAQGPLRTIKERAAASTAEQGPDGQEQDQDQDPDQDPDGQQPDGQQPEKPDPDEDSWRRSIPWGKVLLASLAVTVLALAGITVVEAIAGKPISSVTGGSDSQGTTVGNVTGSDRSQKDTGPSDGTNPGSDNRDQNDEPAPDPNSGRQDDEPQVPEPSAPSTPEPTDGQSVVPEVPQPS